MRAVTCTAHQWTGAAEADLACWKLGGSARTFYIATSEVSARVEVPVPVMVRLADMINGRRVLEGKTVSHGLFLSRAPGAKLTTLYSWRAS